MQFIYDELTLLYVDLSLSELTQSSFIECPLFGPYLNSVFSLRSVQWGGGGQQRSLLTKEVLARNVYREDVCVSPTDCTF